MRQAFAPLLLASASLPQLYCSHHSRPGAGLPRDMELNSTTPLAPARDAATVILLRDAPQGLEVFLVKRHGLSDVLGGAYVFPGGKLDTEDSMLDSDLHLDQTAAALHAKLAEPGIAPATAMGLFVAAVREAFEESGILFVQDAGRVQAFLPGAAEQSFNTMLTTHSLRLQTQSLVPWSRWITPRMPSVSSKRFDTRFFVAEVPQDQIAKHDDVETTASTWIRPRAALEQYWAGQIEMAPPQIMTLAHLSHFRHVRDVMVQAHGQHPPVIFPETFEAGGERVICYPGDPHHPVTERAMPGPTRVLYRNRRFEPEAGFEALFEGS